jgi:DME family drug/metabolite transporter
VGALAGLGAAVLWAITNLILRDQVHKLGGATTQAWRTAVSTLIFIPIFLLARHPRDLLGIPADIIGLLLLSVLMSMVIGDILQFTAIRRIGLSLAMPIASSSPLLTLLVAAATLGEPITPQAVGGSALVIVGVIMVALPRRALDEAERAQRRALTANHWLGVSLALAAAICSAAANTLTRAAIVDIDILSANLLRLPFSAILCAAIGTAQRRELPWRVERGSLIPLCLAGLTGLGSGLCYLNAIKLVGASTTATLNASAPIFGLFGAVFFLGERPTTRNVVGTLIAFAGVALVV